MYYGRLAGWPCLRFNEAQALAWFLVSSWGGSTTPRRCPRLHKPDHGASPRCTPSGPPRPAPSGLPPQGLVRLFTGWERRSPRSPQGSSPGQGRGSCPTGASAAQCGRVLPAPYLRGVLRSRRCSSLPPHPRRSRNPGYSSRRLSRCSACACDCPDSNRSHGPARRHQSGLRAEPPAPEAGSGWARLPRVAQHPAAQRAHGSQPPRRRERTSGSPTQTVRHGPGTTASLHGARVIHTAAFLTCGHDRCSGRHSLHPPPRLRLGRPRARTG